eukprot:PhF_6_TR36197/c0_g1_i2/m.52781
MTNLQQLYLQECEKANVHRNTAVLKALPSDPTHTLTVLDLNNNLVGAKGFLAVVHTVKVCPHLKVLHAADNYLTNECIIEMCDVLDHLDRIESFDFSNNPISHLAGKRVSAYCTRHPTVVSVKIEGTLINKALSKIIDSKCIANTNAANGIVDNKNKQAAPPAADSNNTTTTEAPPPQPSSPTTVSSYPSYLELIANVAASQNLSSAHICTVASALSSSSSEVTEESNTSTSSAAPTKAHPIPPRPPQQQAPSTSHRPNSSSKGVQGGTTTTSTQPPALNNIRVVMTNALGLCGDDVTAGSKVYPALFAMMQLMDPAFMKELKEQKPSGSSSSSKHTHLQSLANAILIDEWSTRPSLKKLMSYLELLPSTVKVQDDAEDPSDKQWPRLRFLQRLTPNDEDFVHLRILWQSLTPQSFSSTSQSNLLSSNSQPNMASSSPTTREPTAADIDPRYPHLSIMLQWAGPEYRTLRAFWQVRPKPGQEKVTHPGQQQQQVQHHPWFRAFMNHVQGTSKAEDLVFLKRLWLAEVEMEKNRSIRKQSLY